MHSKAFTDAQQPPEVIVFVPAAPACPRFGIPLVEAFVTNHQTTIGAVFVMAPIVGVEHACSWIGPALELKRRTWFRSVGSTSPLAADTSAMGCTLIPAKLA